MFSAIRIPRIADEIADQIRQAIWEGRLEEGDRLPSERVMAEQFGVSRPKIREAIRELEHAQLLRVAGGRAGGIYVAPQVAGAPAPAGRPLDADDVAELLHARRLLEPRVAQLAALRGTAEDLNRLDALVARQREADGDLARAHHLDTRFRLAIADMAHNAILSSTVRSISGRLSSVTEAIGDELDYGQLIALNEELAAALRGGAYDEIEDLVGRQLAVVEQAWERHQGRPLVRQPPDFLVRS